MTDADTGSLSKETGIRNTLKRYLGPDGVIMILLVLLSIVGIGITGLFTAAQSLVLARDGRCNRDCLYRHGVVPRSEKEPQCNDPH